MNLGETDFFEEMMGKDVENVFPALRRFVTPRKSVQRARPGTFANGMAYSYHCPQCGYAARVLVSWAELVVVAAGVRPQEAVGIDAAPWQMDAVHPTAFGPAVKCPCPTCHEENAPFLIEIEEAKQDLAAHPYHVAHRDVIRVKGLLATFAPEPVSGQPIVFDDGGKVAVPVVRPSPVVTMGRAFGEAPALEEEKDIASALGMNEADPVRTALVQLTGVLAVEEDLNRMTRLRHALEAIEAIDEQPSLVTDRQDAEIREETRWRLGILATAERDPARRAILREAIDRLRALMAPRPSPSFQGVGVTDAAVETALGEPETKDKS